MSDNSAASGSIVNDPARCLVCQRDRAETFFEFTAAPVFIGTRWPDRESALACEKGDLLLAYCPDCGFVWNRAFDPKLLEYSTDYENSLHFSPIFQSYTQEVVARLVSQYPVAGKTVHDIGCGKGDFLAALCEAGLGEGIGFDPSYEGERVDSPAKDRLTFIRDLYSERYSEYQADLLTSRYVFEHIDDPVGFLRMVRSMVGDRLETVLYFEVPNIRLILERLSVWDIIYEHCSYFGEESLAEVFGRCGFEVLDVRDGYEGQFVSVEAKPSEVENIDLGQSRGDLQQLEILVKSFCQRFDTQLEDWSRIVEGFRHDAKRVVAWGAGAKAVSFMNMLGLQETIPYVVDINPHKQGFYLGGSGQEIVSPSALTDYRPDVIILMNPIYRHEIEGAVRDLGVEVEFIEAS